MADNSTAPFYRDQKRLATYMGFADDVDAFYAWMESEHFKPYFLELLAVLQPVKMEALRTGKPPELPYDLRAVQIALGRERGSGRNRFGRHPKKAEFELVDHYAYFILGVFQENTMDRDGAFFNKDYTEDECMLRIWQVYLRCNWQCSDSKVKSNSRESLIFELRQPTRKEQKSKALTSGKQEEAPHEWTREQEEEFFRKYREENSTAESTRLAEKDRCLEEEFEAMFIEGKLEQVEEASHSTSYE